MSLPALFCTELHSVPSHVPYLHAQQECPRHLSLDPPPGGLNVGLVWASNPENKAMYRNKSMPLDVLMPMLTDLLNLGLIELHSLQFGQDSEQLKPWLGLDGVKDWHQELNDFSDTAHLIQQLDLIISVDTAVAHLQEPSIVLPGCYFRRMQISVGLKIGRTHLGIPPCEFSASVNMVIGLGSSRTYGLPFRTLLCWTSVR